MPLSLDNIVLKHGHKTIVEGLSLTIFTGSVCCVTGANGAGKTTLIKAVAGLHPLKGGVITFAGESIEKCQEYLGDISLLSHSHGLRVELSAEENIRFWASLYGTELMVPSLISAFNLEAALEKDIIHLSQGMRKKIAIICMLLANKSIWLMDEPFANLDSKATETLWQFIETKADRGGLVIFTSHNKEDNKRSHIEIRLS